MILNFHAKNSICSSVNFYGARNTDLECKGMRSADFTLMDSKLRLNLGWIFCLIFACEGLFGMVPAIYMDYDGSNCISTQTYSMSIEGYVAAHVLLHSILPFILPFGILIYPLIELMKNLKKVQDEFKRQILRNVVVLCSSYILIYLPVALLTIIIFPTILQ